MSGEVVGERLMKKRTYINTESAQVLGLPMYLIIVMVVAVAVIAAVIFMIPQGTQTMDALVTENAVIAEDPGNASAFQFSAPYPITIKVSTNTERADPIQGASVILVGAGIAETATTDGAGIAKFSIQPSLAENTNENAIKLVVKAAGFEDFTDTQAIMVYRL
jgi:hypothetical protein